jgi:hypothetical protein
MADRPIVFSAPMVLALIAGTKTQTRRILKKQDLDEAAARQYPHQVWGLPCLPGDSLWVRESLGRRTASFLGIEATNGVEEAFYKADGTDVLDPRGFNLCPWWKGPTCSPRHMPRGISRLTLQVTDVRVQRLAEITDLDAIDEGACRVELDAQGPHSERGKPPLGPSPRQRFAHLWDSLHGKGAFDASPWVAALTFTVTPANIDSLPEHP